MSGDGLRIRGAPLEARGLSKAFGGARVVSDVSFRVEGGALLTLLGPSGSGKTTTLRMIAGFEDPDAGQILVGGEDITERPAHRRNIGVVFQQYALFPHLTVSQNVAYPLEMRRYGRAEIRSRVGAALDLVRLQGYETRYPRQLSGGQQQRVALARAIVIRPRVLLFDEPLSNLDARLRVQMRDEIRRLQKELAITTVYVTHDQEEAMAVSDRIAVMSAGEVVQEGTAEDLYHRPATEFVAQFIGRVNLLAGRVVDAAGATVTVDVAGVRLRVFHTAPLRTGDAVRLAIRPEAIVLAPDDPGAEGEVVGAIVARTFLGEKVDYTVRAGAQSFLVTRYNPGPGAVLEEGQRVRLTLASDAMQLLPVEG